mmetsp:Transcript_12337/g.14525  ORF Transcript_12337/g.14525 Transcript_12337/m.14525 type:complete len:80 (-) Transcript_12337:30-269(-)
MAAPATRLLVPTESREARIWRRSFFVVVAAPTPDVGARDDTGMITKDDRMEVNRTPSTWNRIIVSSVCIQYVCVQLFDY